MQELLEQHQRSPPGAPKQKRNRLCVELEGLPCPLLTKLLVQHTGNAKHLQPETPCSRPEIRNPKPKTRDPNRNPDPDPESETRSVS